MRLSRYMPKVILKVFGSLFVFLAWGEKVTVVNQGEAPFYTAMYEYNRASGSAQRVQEPMRVEAGGKAVFAYSKLPFVKRATHYYILAYDKQKAALKQKFNKKAVSQMSTMLIGKAQELRVPAKKDLPAVKDYVSVTNLSSQPMFAALYIVSKKDERSVTRYSDVERIDPESRALLARPDFAFREKIRKDRVILFHEDANTLAETVQFDTWEQIPHMRAGVLNGSAFFIAEDLSGKVRGYDQFTWKTQNLKGKAKQVIEKVSQAATDPFVHKVRKELLSSSQNPWANKTARVRTGKEVAAEEKRIINARDKQIRKAVARLLGRELQDDEKTPRIALVCSGGGFRAMFATLGGMQGAYENNIWEALSYVVGLSGSTWAIAPYMTSSAHIPQFVTDAISRATKGFAGLKKEMGQLGGQQKLLMRELASRIAFQKTLSLIDLYGFVLGWYLLQGIRSQEKYFHQQATLSHQRNRVEQGKDPVPIYTAVVGETEHHRDGFTWVYFTPFEVGSQEIGGYIPSWGFGRMYRQGASINAAPPYSLGYCMGLWGSVFAASFQQIYYNMIKKVPLNVVKQIFEGIVKTELGEQRIFPAKVPNFVYRMEQPRLRKLEYVSMIDAGFSANIPMTAVTQPEREIDVIIVLDASAQIEPDELRKALDLAKSRGQPMPNLTISGEIATLMKSDRNPRAPAVVYMPMVKNPRYGQFNPKESKFLGAANFFYSQGQAEAVVGLYRRNMQDALPKVQKAIEHAIAQEKA